MDYNQFAPLVSIIIPVYNGSDYMREAIDSALLQTYKNIEVIIVNDGSCDNGATDAIAREYADKVKYLYKENGGVSTALNMGIRHMKGEYFSWLSHDDVYTTDKIEKSVEALSRLEDKRTLVCCDMIHIDKDSKEIVTKNKTVPDRKEKFVGWDQALMRMFKDSSLHGCALLIHRDIFEDVGMFEENLRFIQDVFLWEKIFLSGYNMLTIPYACVKGRIHDKQLTQTGQSLFRVECEKTSEFLIPRLLEISTKEKNFILEYIKYTAKYGIKNATKESYTKAKQKNLISMSSAVTVALWRMYGVVRPLIRKLYYIMFRNIKTS